MVLDLLLLVCKIDQKVFDFPAAECCVPISTFLSLKPISIEGFFFLCVCAIIFLDSASVCCKLIYS